MELIDSLELALPAIRVDMARIMLFNQLGNQYSSIDPETGIRYASQGRYTTGSVRSASTNAPETNMAC
jgi:hypothetical protein